jgi:hypothetical protein
MIMKMTIFMPKAVRATDFVGSPLAAHRAWFLVALLIFSSLLPGTANAQTSVPIHVTIVMHSEQATHYETNPALFESNRTNLYRFAQTLAQRAVMFNFQSDWTFLAGVTNYDRLGRSETGGTNIIAWMQRDLGFEIDPHNHISQSIYNYADVAALIALCGADPSPITGGYIAAPTASNEWPFLQSTITGNVYTSYAWTPGTLWGGGSGNHVDETNLWFSGVYAPRDATNYFEHAAGNMPLVGGYGGRTVAWTNLNQLLAMRTSGQLCEGRMYTVNLMVNMGSITPTFILQFDQQLQLYTNIPNIRWVGISQITNIWATEYAAAPNYLPFSLTNDVDGDALIDGWEVTNFCAITSTDGMSDGDFDDQSDREEYVAGTSPTNDYDYFAVEDINATEVSWYSVSGRRYVLEENAGAGWTSVYEAVATTALMIWTNNIPNTDVWYRLNVSMP